MKSTIKINDQYADLKGFVESVAANGMPADANVFFRWRNTLAVANTPRGEVNIKQFKLPNFINALIYSTFRHSKARRSYEFACRLIELGICTPTPIAYIENRHGIRLRDSYYLSEQIKASEIRYVNSHPDEKGVLEAFGREMVRLHKAGIYMRDFSPGNILFNEDENGEYRFFYVDLNRLNFNVTSANKLMEMFRIIVEDTRQLEIVARSYAIQAGLNVESTVADALLRHEHFKEHSKRKRKLKHILMPWKKKYR